MGERKFFRIQNLTGVLVCLSTDSIMIYDNQPKMNILIKVKDTGSAKIMKFIRNRERKKNFFCVNYFFTSFFGVIFFGWFPWWASRRGVRLRGRICWVPRPAPGQSPWQRRRWTWWRTRYPPPHLLSTSIKIYQDTKTQPICTGRFLSARKKVQS